MPSATVAIDNPRVPEDLANTLVRPAAYADQTIHDVYSWLRRNSPLAIAEPEGFDPFWVVTKHADILEISRNNGLFPSGERATTLNSKAHLERNQKITGSPHLVRSIIQMDEPDHMKYRLLSQAWFMPGNIRKREEAIRELARKAAETLAARGGVSDFVADVALHFPLHVVMEILGVPPEDTPRMLRLTQQLFGAQDPDTARVQAALTAEQYGAMLEAVVADFTAYFETISADRRLNPRDDLASVIANAQVDGAPIPPREAAGYYIIVATAGHDTTASSTAGVMWALATTPGLLERVKADTALIPALIEEAIRWTTPVKTFMRSASQDTELRGQTIRKGDWLMLCYASGNRDEAVFDNPFAFDIDRKPNRQVAFGYGGHVCLGQHLARMEMRILFEELLPRLRSVKLAGEPRSIESWFVNGLKTLPIQFEMD
ncbi:cytochrome P450 [Caulobacter sp. SSI4214]|uniref:cytochrome P450 n=1 Tax=Caulobacter sp. SSI4214 TaxID=2575739 RepID=UPI00143C2825|nr:cytochrome P450 [Caulobacter sp. SSI4214]